MKKRITSASAGRPQPFRRLRMAAVGSALGVAVALGCERDDPDAAWTAEEARTLYSLSPIPALPPSPGNRHADLQAAAVLGHQLFFDQRLSANGKVACATCHKPELYFTDGLVQGRGVGQTARNTPTVIGVAWLPFLFLDGRKDSGWAQALGPLEAEGEHGTDRLAVAHLIHSEYREAYQGVFGPLPPLEQAQRFPARARPVDLDRLHPHAVAWAGMAAADQEAINRVFSNVGKAIEAYERKLTPQPAPFDRYVAALKAGDTQGGGHLSAAARRGLRSFMGRGGCVNCHSGPLLTDKGFHNLGIPQARTATGELVARVESGRGRGAGLVKQDPFRCGEPYSDAKVCLELKYLNPLFEDFLGAFKTPSLRNVAATAPYMHAGQLATLQDVLTFYRTLPGQPRAGHRELSLQRLDSSVDDGDLLAFLASLTGPLPPGPWTKAPLVGLKP